MSAIEARPSAASPAHPGRPFDAPRGCRDSTDSERAPLALFLAVDAALERLTGRARVLAQRALARAALAAAARRAGVALDALATDADGAPLARGGVWFSTSHAGGLAAAVVARAPVGVDVESSARGRLDAARARLDARERALLGEPTPLALVRHWSAVEAVLKQAGVGLAGLRGCRLAAALEPDLALVSFGARVFRVHQTLFGEHVASLCCDHQADVAPTWHILGGARA